MALLAPLLACLAAVAGAMALATSADTVVVRRAGISDGPRVARDPGVRDALRSGLARLGTTRIARAVPRPGRTDRLRLAGWRSVGAEELAGAGIALGGAGAMLVVLALGDVSLLTLPVALAGLLVPDLVVARAAARRSAAMDRELPQLLDLLAAASHAGLSGPLALRRSVEVTTGPLAEELGAVLEAVDLGGRWREELRATAERLQLPDLARAVTVLTRTETLGSSLADAMTELAARVREARRAATTERARKAPVKMLFPLVFLVLPAFLLLTVVPVLFSTVQSIR